MCKPRDLLMSAVHEGGTGARQINISIRFHIEVCLICPALPFERVEQFWTIFSPR
jgi:hypothetical protein